MESIEAQTTCIDYVAAACMMGQHTDCGYIHACLHSYGRVVIIYNTYTHAKATYETPITSSPTRTGRASPVRGSCMYMYIYIYMYSIM